MIKAAFCDDDLIDLEKMGTLIKKYCETRGHEIVYAMFRSPLDVLEEIEKGMHWDVLFLDVIMPGQNGIEVAREIRQHDTDVKIIFLTSSGEFAVESYTVGAYFYQLKPICEDQFFELLDSVVEMHEQVQLGSLLLFAKGGVRRIELEKFEYCEVMRRTLFFYMENGDVFEGGGGMDELCKKLLPYGNFLRPHRSYLVNMEYIQSVTYKAIVMNSGVKIPIPHGKYSQIKEEYLAYAMSRKLVFLS